MSNELTISCDGDSGRSYDGDLLVEAFGENCKECLLTIKNEGGHLYKNDTLVDATTLTNNDCVQQIGHETFTHCKNCGNC